MDTGIYGNGKLLTRGPIDTGIYGHLDLWTRGSIDTGIYRHGDLWTQGSMDTGFYGHGDLWTRGSIDTGIHRHGDLSTRGSIDTGIYRHSRPSCVFSFFDRRECVSVLGTETYSFVLLSFGRIAVFSTDSAPLYVWSPSPSSTPQPSAQFTGFPHEKVSTDLTGG